MKYLYTIEDNYADLADEVINEKDELQHLVSNEVKIGFVESTERKKGNGKLVFADTRLVKGVWTAFCSYDFIITFYTPNIQLLDEEQIRILMWHELKHCGVDEKGKCYLIPHDIEDFADILQIHGLDWANSKQVGGDSELE